MSFIISSNQKAMDSLAFTPHVPDTPAAGVCARSDNPGAMPTPERIAKRLVLSRGDFTLAPPEASDQAWLDATAVYNMAFGAMPILTMCWMSG